MLPFFSVCFTEPHADQHHAKTDRGTEEVNQDIGYKAGSSRKALNILIDHGNTEKIQKCTANMIVFGVRTPHAFVSASHTPQQPADAASECAEFHAMRELSHKLVECFVCHLFVGVKDRSDGIRNGFAFGVGRLAVLQRIMENICRDEHGAKKNQQNCGCQYLFHKLPLFDVFSTPGVEPG